MFYYYLINGQCVPLSQNILPILKAVSDPTTFTVFNDKFSSLSTNIVGLMMIAMLL